MIMIKYSSTAVFQVLFLIFLCTNTASSAVKEYFISCNPDDFEYINQHPYPDFYIPITFTYDGRTWENVSMRVRGDDSRIHPKKSLKVKFNGESFENGRDRLNFNAEYEDPTYMCQYLATRAFKMAGYSCFESEHARLYINGKFLGLYLRIENMDDLFLKGQGLDPNGNLYKATEDDASLSIYDDIYSLWEKKTNTGSGKEDLQELIDSLFYVPDNEYYNFTQRFFDYEKMVDIIAINMLLANGSTYYHNYFMYHDIYNSDKWIMLPWDMDKTYSQYGYFYSYHRSSSHYSPDNPFLERAIIDNRIFSDINNKMDNLIDSFFNNEVFDPIIDSLKLLLRLSVEEDEQDNITSMDFWADRVGKIKEYLTKRPEALEYQFEHYPTPFKVEFTEGTYSDSIKFIWHPSKHPGGGQITYNLHFGEKENLEDTSVTLVIRGLIDTTYIMRDLPSSGLFYWKVVATNGNDNTNGYNYPNKLLIKEPTELPCTISSNMRLTKDKSPYSVNCNIEVKNTADLTIDKGVEIIFKGDYRILIRGSLKVNGTKKEPVRFVPDSFTPKWDNIYFHYATDVCTLNNVIIQNGCIYSQNSLLDFDSLNLNFNYQDTAYAIPLMYLDITSASIHNSVIRSNGNRQGFIIIDADNITVENSKFFDVPDAVEFSLVDNGKIINNLINNSTDDCIDLNACSNIIISNNVINNAADKGISLGNENWGKSCQDIIIERNVISGTESAIAVKDGSKVKIINNTLYNNTVSINCYEKRASQGGGSAEIINTIMAKNKNAILLDEKSKAIVSYSLAEDTLIAGEGNLMADPLFINSDNYDFRLQSGSPCIDAGDPESSLDPDWTRADMGALPTGIPLNLPKIVINEINYNSSDEFDTGDWIELYNADTVDIDISGWIFMDSDNSHKFLFPDGFILESSAYVILCRQLDRFSDQFPDVKNIIGEFDFGLSSNGELIRLYDDNDVLIDSLTFGIESPWASEPNGGGPTLELNSPEADNSFAGNWHASKKHGTPGMKNGTDTSIKDIELKLVIYNIPNPFSKLSRIIVETESECNATIKIFNSLGQELAVLFTGQLIMGSNEFMLNASHFSAGIYYCQLNTDFCTKTLVLSHIK